MIKVSTTVNLTRLNDTQARQSRLREIIETARTSATRSTNEHVFQRKLESHLYDVKTQKPWRTPTVHSELRHRHIDNRDALADINPEAMRMYVGLISGMGYRQQARLASNVFQMSKSLDQLSTVSERLAEIKPKTQADIARSALPTSDDHS